MPKRKRVQASKQFSLPEQFRDPDVDPLEFRPQKKKKNKKKSATKPLWTHQQPGQDTRLGVLRHLAAYSTAPYAGRTAKREASFLNDPPAVTPAEPCWTLKRGPGIKLRIVPEPRYSWFCVGHKPVQEEEIGCRNVTVERSKTVPVGLDAHRLVLWLVRGPPPAAPNTFAIHLCDNKRCVRPGHLQWNSQSVNVSSASAKKKGKKSADREKRSGACSSCNASASPCLVEMHCMSCRGANGRLGG